MVLSQFGCKHTSESKLWQVPGSMFHLEVLSELSLEAMTPENLTLCGKQTVELP